MLIPRQGKRNVVHWQKIQETIKIIYWAEDYNIDFEVYVEEEKFDQKKYIIQKDIYIYMVYDRAELKSAMKHILQILSHYNISSLCYVISYYQFKAWLHGKNSNRSHTKCSLIDQVTTFFFFFNHKLLIKMNLSSKSENEQGRQ